MKEQITDLAQQVYDGMKAEVEKEQIGHEGYKKILSNLFKSSNASICFCSDRQKAEKEIDYYPQIISFSDDVYTIIYGVYAYLLQYAKWKKYPNFNIIASNEEIPKDVLFFLKYLNINYDIYTKEQENILRNKDAGKEKLLIVSPERFFCIKDNLQEKITCYIYEENFDKIFHSGCLSQKTFMVLLNNYIRNVQPSQKQTRIKPSIVKRWEKQYISIQYNEKADEESVYRLLQEHESKLKDFQISCRNL